MPTIEQNFETWQRDWDWSTGGEEWSRWWGSSVAQWNQTILPRIVDLLPAQTALEIGPGYGRWTVHLRECASALVLVDLSERCINSCRARFRDDTNIAYVVNDGRSLDMLPDNSIDFVFSFDSLVHAEADVIRSYLGDLGRKLSGDGRGFIHHSNWYAYRVYLALMHRMPRKVRTRLTGLGLLDDLRWRAGTMSAALFRRYAEDAGLVVVNQELVNWGTHRLGDCFSTFTRAGSRWDRPLRMIGNRRFMDEAAAVKQGTHP